MTLFESKIFFSNSIYSLPLILVSLAAGLTQRQTAIRIHPTGNLELPVNLNPLTTCLWTVGRSQSPRSESTQTQGDRKKYSETQKGPDQGVESNSGLSCCEHDHATMLPSLSNYFQIIYY